VDFSQINFLFDFNRLAVLALQNQSFCVLALVLQITANCRLSPTLLGLLLHALQAALPLVQLLMHSAGADQRL
jgi:hypothetical protein